MKILYRHELVVILSLDYNLLGQSPNYFQNLGKLWRWSRSKCTLIHFHFKIWYEVAVYKLKVRFDYGLIDALMWTVVWFIFLFLVEGGLAVRGRWLAHSSSPVYTTAWSIDNIRLFFTKLYVASKAESTFVLRTFSSTWFVISTCSIHSWVIWCILFRTNTNQLLYRIISQTFHCCSSRHRLGM